MRHGRSADRAAPTPLDAVEAQAYATLQQQAHDAGGSLTVGVTGPLRQTDEGYRLEVRQIIAQSN